MEAHQGFAAEERSILRGKQVDAKGISLFLNWYPVTISVGNKSVWWRNMGNRRFVEPFFHDSLTAQNRDDRQVCQTPLDALDEIVSSISCVTPTAFIFHVSRCGSTLLTQMLASLEQCIVMSEPPVIDAFFRLHHAHPDLPDAQLRFKQVIAVLAQQRHTHEQHFFVKFDSWHLPWLPFIREAFPEVPFIFLYREPAAVLASHHRQCGPQMVPGLLDTTLLQPELTGNMATDFRAYGEAVLESIFRAGLAHAEVVNLILLNYEQLPDVLWRDLLLFFNITCSSQQLEKMHARSSLHSKHRSVTYTGDPRLDSRQEKHVAQLDLSVLNSLYVRLETCRQKSQFL